MARLVSCYDGLQSGYLLTLRPSWSVLYNSPVTQGSVAGSCDLSNSASHAIYIYSEGGGGRASLTVWLSNSTASKTKTPADCLKPIVGCSSEVPWTSGEQGNSVSCFRDLLLYAISIYISLPPMISYRDNRYISQ